MAGGYGGGYGGQGDLGALMQMMQGGGIFGLGDVATGGLFTAGGALLGGLGQLMAGPSWGEKAAKETYGLAKNRLGQSVLEPDQYLADFMRSMAPMVSKEGMRISQRVGLDSGVAQGALWDAQTAPLAQYMFQMKSMADRLKAQNDNSLLALMGSLSARG